MKPSDFKKFPYDSVKQNSEAETIARNIMTILARTKNEFRELGWDEYKSERLKDIDFSESEKFYFHEVIDYFKSTETAQLFSPEWGNQE